MDTPEDGTGSAGSSPAESRPNEPQPGEDPPGQPGAEETAVFPPGPGGPPPRDTGTPEARARAVTAWQAFRAWRRSRPFWGGLLLVLAGLELLAIPLLSVLAHGSVKVVIYIGIGGVFGVLIGGLLVACGLLIWFHPVQRIFYAIAGVLLAVASFVATNLGGFFLGMLLGVTAPRSASAGPRARVGWPASTVRGHGGRGPRPKAWALCWTPGPPRKALPARADRVSQGELGRRGQTTRRGGHRETQTRPRGHAARPGRPAAAWPGGQRGAAGGRQPARLRHPGADPVPVTQSHSLAQQQPVPGPQQAPPARPRRPARRPPAVPRRIRPRARARPRRAGRRPRSRPRRLGACRSAKPSSPWSPVRRCCLARPTREWRRSPRPAGRPCP